MSDATPKARLASLLDRAIAESFPACSDTRVELDRPRSADHGDFATNVALQLAKRVGRKPREVAEAIVAALGAPPEITRADIAGPGFINFTLAPAARFAAIPAVLSAGERYGHGDQGDGRAIMVEFVSANPTGPLHVGHGRQAALGDAISTLLEWQSWRVLREFYYNDAGNQIANLGLSTRFRLRERAGEPGEMPADGYHGQYIHDIARDYTAENPRDPLGEDLDAVRRFAVAYLRGEQDADLRAFGVAFDSYYLESSLYDDGKVDEAVRLLQAAGHTYEADGALWLRTTDFGDDKDRVMRKSDGAYTYFVPDVAYHLTKFRRGYVAAVNVQGADHHSTVTRVRAGLQALGLGIPEGYPAYVLHQMVTVMRGGEEVKISKRAGSYVTLRDLIEWTSKDAVRFFLLSRKADTEYIFDVDLAIARNTDNPVYYVQYAHARICRVFEEWGGMADALDGADLAPLTASHELALMQRLAEYPETVAGAARELAPHLLVHYLQMLAGDFHAWYNAEKFLVEDAATKLARLALADATRIAIVNGLALLGVSAPEKM